MFNVVKIHYIISQIPNYMDDKKRHKTEEISTEAKIKEAARKVFTKKGYAATRTRDIAEESGINLALLNYYFRSKERLFQIIMAEKLQQFLGVVKPVINRETLSLEEKIEQLAENYIDMLLENPDLPLFVFTEMRHNPNLLNEQEEIQDMLKNSSLVRQVQERKPDREPVQFIISLLGMTIFPFMARPLLFSDNEEFKKLMEERKQLIKLWAKALLNI